MNHKYHRGDRFIIEIAEVHTHYKDNGDPYPLYRIKGFDSMVMTNIALDRLEKQLIRCKDCKFYSNGWCKVHYRELVCEGEFPVNEEDFCSQAIRKDEN